jgi:hypothetical protein
MIHMPTAERNDAKQEAFDLTSLNSFRSSRHFLDPLGEVAVMNLVCEHVEADSLDA